MLQHMSTMRAGDLNFAKFSQIGKWVYGFENTRECWADHHTYDGSNIGGSAPVTGILVNEKGWHRQEDIVSRNVHMLPIETLRIKQG